MFLYGLYKLAVVSPLLPKLCTFLIVSFIII